MYHNIYNSLVHCCLKKKCTVIQKLYKRISSQVNILMTNHFTSSTKLKGMEGTMGGTSSVSGHRTREARLPAVNS